MNFGYVEDEKKKNALVKVSVCKECGDKLNYKKKLKKVRNEWWYIKLKYESKYFLERFFGKVLKERMQ